MKLEDALARPEGPERTSALVSWVQGLFHDQDRVPVLVDRLGAWEYWKSGVDGANAFEVYRSCRKDLDEERLNQRARDEGFESALEALRTFAATWSSNDPSPEELETWANRGPGSEQG